MEVMVDTISNGDAASEEDIQEVETEGARRRRLMGLADDAALPAPGLEEGSSEDEGAVSMNGSEMYSESESEWGDMEFDDSGYYEVSEEPEERPPKKRRKGRQGGTPDAGWQEDAKPPGRGRKKKNGVKKGGGKPAANGTASGKAGGKRKGRRKGRGTRV
mmetsp:Transcript_51859/g.137129  ORF Transcript_51859/g.137129 Transcript_51859/m.137129 type:complete len:160 (+) Transcript_51859:41-520(+)